jgi:hypothetical protein
MTKFYGLIITARPHIYSLGKHEDVDAAEAFAEQFCDRKNSEREQFLNKWRTEHPQSPAQGDAIPEPDIPTYSLAFIMDESDLRGIVGEVVRPLVILRLKEAVSVETPREHGGDEEEETETRGAISFSDTSTRYDNSPIPEPPMETGGLR